jgi:hypothetical protein
VPVGVAAAPASGGVRATGARAARSRARSTHATQTQTAGRLATRIVGAAAGWVAARAWGRRRNSYGHALWAHTSPVYLRERAESARARASAQTFVERIEAALGWVERGARFEHAQQRARMLELFREGQGYFRRLAGR